MKIIMDVKRRDTVALLLMTMALSPIYQIIFVGFAVALSALDAPWTDIASMPMLYQFRIGFMPFGVGRRLGKSVALPNNRSGCWASLRSAQPTKSYQKLNIHSEMVLMVILFMDVIGKLVFFAVFTGLREFLWQPVCRLSWR
ncbi:MAG: hypothetical protein RKP20_16995 [Candidatus Competibacter sp.]|nr:hypothetical protein [Candidatus Competibacter sp.]